MISVERDNGVTIITIEEPQLQMYVIPQFKNAVKTVLEEKPGMVIFDMKVVQHVDSSAMGALFHFQKFIREYGGRIALANVSTKVMQIFKITKSDTNLEIFDSVARALKSVS